MTPAGPPPVYPRTPDWSAFARAVEAFVANVRAALDRVAAAAPTPANRRVARRHRRARRRAILRHVREHRRTRKAIRR